MNFKGMKIQFCIDRKKKMLFHVRRNKKMMMLWGFLVILAWLFETFFFCFSSYFLFVHSILPSLNGSGETKQKLCEERKQWKYDFKVWFKNWVI